MATSGSLYRARCSSAISSAPFSGPAPSTPSDRIASTRASTALRSPLLTELSSFIADSERVAVDCLVQETVDQCWSSDVAVALRGRPGVRRAITVDSYPDRTNWPQSANQLSEAAVGAASGTASAPQA